MRPLVTAEINGSERIPMRANDFPRAAAALKSEKALQFSLKGLSQ
ncbi:hypothetical protein JMUB6875_10000 [Nocardia sp. JMUB6875]